MCGHLAEQTEENLNFDNYIEQFQMEFNQIDFRKAPILNIYNNGSFIIDQELPEDVRNKILEAVYDKPDLQMLVVETRPEFVTTEKLVAIRDQTKSKHVEVAMGLEIKNNFYRKLLINKGFDLCQYNHTAGIIATHLNLRTYVLLKPPFLSEEDGIINAIETIRHSFNMGSKTVSLEACTVQNFTLVKWLHDRDLFRPPWLWSIIEVVKATHHLGKLIVGLFQFFPSPNIVPYNCSQCSEKVYNAIQEYNRTLDIQHFNGLSCSCQKTWKEELKTNKNNVEGTFKILSELTKHKSLRAPCIPKASNSHRKPISSNLI